MPPNNPNQPFQPGQDPNMPPTPNVVVPPNAPQPQQNIQTPQQPAADYDFIVHPQERPKPKPFSNTKLPVKIAIIGGGILFLLIVFNIFRGIIAGPPIGEKFLSVAQDQQQILTIATVASDQQGLSTINSNSVITTKLGITTDQANTLEYMAKTGKKVKPEVLTKTLNSNLTAQLEASAAAGTFNETYKTVMTQQLNAYMNNMAQLYKQIDGKNGRALLDENYKAAKLLLQQLEAT